MSGEIETAQLVPLDDNTNQRRQAAITCAARPLTEGGTHEQLLELLRELGLVHDPHALDRHPIDTSSARSRGPQQ